jgi:signal-transduction protein with cAMP-binding, CBS, and nucleotidyltransferase domain
MKLNILVGDVMTRAVKRIDANDPIDKAAQIMRNERIGSVVAMGEKHVKGIVTTTDIVYKHVAGKKGTQVRDIMSTDLVTIKPSATIEEAARMMTKRGVEKVLVFDNDNFVGIITNNDILRVEPAIVEILLERIRMGGPKPPSDASINECESCGNYSDSIEEVNGTYLCAECRNEE